MTKYHLEIISVLKGGYIPAFKKSTLRVIILFKTQLTYDVTLDKLLKLSVPVS